MDLSLDTCFVQITDPDAALAFYTTTLGLELRNDVAKDSFRWITVGAPNGPSIVLSNFVAGSPDDAAALAAMVTKGAIQEAHFASSDLDATHEALVAAGAEIVSPPETQPWGARDMAVRDPSGNLIRINQR